MYELVFTIITVINGQVGLSQTVLDKFTTQEDCTAVMSIAQQHLAKTAQDSRTVPGLLECRRTA